MSNVGCNQRIGCRVEKCQYNDRGESCGLDSIEVRSNPDSTNRNSPEDTLCGSYKFKTIPHDGY